MVSYLPKLNCLAPFILLLLTGEVQTTFKRLYFGLNLLGDLAKRGTEAPLA